MNLKTRRDRLLPMTALATLALGCIHLGRLFTDPPLDHLLLHAAAALVTLPAAALLQTRFRLECQVAAFVVAIMSGLGVLLAVTLGHPGVGSHPLGLDDVAVGMLAGFIPVAVSLSIFRPAGDTTQPPG